MAKNELNQNSKLTEEFTNTFEQNFKYVNNPINRFDVSKDNTTKNLLKKAEKLARLKEQINSIENCNLKKNSHSLIMGDGNVNSPIMIIGEAPGKEEDQTGICFQGEVGKLLRKMFNAINIKLDDIYLSYAINFMTPDDRKPTSQEIKRYSSFLKEHITIIDPKIIVLMGSTAMESLTGLNRGISKERGKWNEIILENNTLSYIITFSPSYLIRFPEYKKYSWEDLKMIRQKIHDLNLKIK